MNRSANRSTLFLTELIIDLFIFIVCAAVCVGILVRAYGMSRESVALSEAVYIAQSAAERYRAGGEVPMTYYRADGTPCLTEQERSESAYRVELAEAEQVAGDLLPAMEILVFTTDGDDTPCYRLTVKSIRGVTGS